MTAGGELVSGDAAVPIPTPAAPFLALLTRLAADERGATVTWEATPGESALPPAWVDLFADVGESSVRAIAVRLTRELDATAAQAPDEVEGVADLVRAVADLCRAARRAKLPVVYRAR